jgi:signal peptidase I
VSIRNGYYRNNNDRGVLGCRENQTVLREMPDTLISPEVMCAMPYDEHLPKWTIKNFGPLYIPRKGDVITITPKEAVLYLAILEWELKGKITIDWEKNKVFIKHKLLSRHTFLHDYYFAGGDNVVDSHDSRYWGLVPDIYIIGIVKRIEYSKARVTGKYDWRRFLRCVK